MSPSNYLFAEATWKAMRAERCREVADMLTARQAAMTERHLPVLALHREDVWRGRAATYSRTKLRQAIGASLHVAGIDLAATIGSLRLAAHDLDSEAAVLRVRARARAVAEAQARMSPESRPETPA